MGRPKLKIMPDAVRKILDYVNGEGMHFENGTFHKPKDRVLEGTRGFLSGLVEIARSPVRDQDISLRVWNRIRFNEDGRIELTPLPDEHPIVESILKLHEDELKRILLCPGCDKFVWRKKIDSQTCGRKCADRYNNQKRKERR